MKKRLRILLVALLALSLLVSGPALAEEGLEIVETDALEALDTPDVGGFPSTARRW